MEKMKSCFVAILAVFFVVFPSEASKKGSFTGRYMNGGRIIGGRAGDHSKFPFLVSIQRLRKGSEWRQHCGGSIVTSTVVLTACHCIVEVVKMTPFIVLNPSVLRVVAGVGDVTDYPNRQTAIAERLIPHPRCENTPELPYFSDSAVLILQEPLLFNPGVQPLKVFSYESSIAAAKLKSLQNTGATCTIAGWGRTSIDRRDYGPNLQIAQVTLLSTEKCQSTFCQLGVSRFCHRDFSALKQFCAIGSNRSSICFADSGGPLVCNGFVFGVVSYGSTKCLVEWPGMFSNVEIILQMINAVVSNQTVEYNGPRRI